MKEVFAYIDRHRGQYLSWLQELCRQPSVAAQNRGMAETVLLVERFLGKTSAQVERLPTSGYPVIYGEIDNGAPRTLSFYNHYDVQPEDPLDEWESDPFGAEIREGKLYARGAADNKGNLMARICAVHAYEQVHGKLPINVKFIFEGEEEIGSVHLEEFAERYPHKIHSDGCIWEFGYKNHDGRLQVSLGVKGMCYVELKVTGANTDLHSSQAAIVENPAWRLVWALNTLKDEQERIQIEGFYERVEEPTAEELKMLQEMDFEEESVLQNLGLHSFLLDLHGLDLKKKLQFQPTCTICGIETGYTGEGSKTVLPSEARAKLDFRLVSNQDPQQILQLLRNHLDKHGFSDIETADLTGEHPAKTDPDDPLVQTVSKHVKDVYGRPPVLYRMSPGTGPMYVLCQKHGIPAVSIGVGNENSRNHAPNENIYVNDYVDGIKMMAVILHEFSRSEHGQ